MAVAIMLLATSCKIIANHPPVITSLKAKQDVVSTLDSCLIECVASDPDGDELSYEWSTDGGEISDTGSLATWTAPDTVGLYKIAVVVSDGYGAEETKSLTVSVALKLPPTIEELIVTPENPRYLKEAPKGYQILGGWSCDIKCIISDVSDDLIYQWSCDGGAISGGGSIVTWMAPNERDEVTITVTVSGAGSSTTSKSIVFEVEDYPCAFECG